MELRRVLGLRTVVSTSAGLTLATSCFIAAAQLAGALLGDAAWIAILIAGLLSLLAAASFSELNGMYPTSAGLRLYMQHAFGERTAIVVSFFYMLVVTSVVGAEAYVLGRVLTHALPAISPLLWIVVLLAAASLVNLRGVKVAGWLQDVITYGMVLSLIAISIVGLVKLGWRLPHPFATGGAADLFTAVATGIFLFIGFEWVTPLAEEVTDGRMISRGMFLAIGLLSVVYALFTAVMAPFLSRAELLGSPIPHVLFAERILGPAGMVWMLLTSLAASVTTFNAGLVTVSRFVYAGARESLLPKPLARIHLRNATPGNAIFAVGLLGIAVSALVFLSGNYLVLVFAGAATEALIWAVAGATLLVLRKKRPDVPRPYKVWNAWLVGSAAVLLFGTLGVGALVSSPASALWMLAGLAACAAHVHWVVPRLKARAEAQRQTALARRGRRPRPAEPPLADVVSEG